MNLPKRVGRRVFRFFFFKKNRNDDDNIHRLRVSDELLYRQTVVGTSGLAIIGTREGRRISPSFVNGADYY